jgi:molybdopterin synthase catalytic subunit
LGAIAWNCSSIARQRSGMPWLAFAPFQAAIESRPGHCALLTCIRSRSNRALPQMMSSLFCRRWPAADSVFLQSTPLQLDALIAQVESPARGGVASFLGIVRNHQNGRNVLRLEYSAYAPMAEAECARIVAEAEDRWDCAVALAHRLGTLQVGDTAVAIAAAASHREEAFAACRYVIEEVKRRVPIWKREFFGDGSVEWVGGGGAGKPVSGEVGKRGGGEATDEVKIGAARRDGAE